MGWPRRPPSNPVLLPRVTAICDPQQPGWPAGATAPSTPQARGGGIALLSASCDWGLRRVPATQRPTRGHTPAGPTLHVDPVTATCDAMPPRARHPLAVSVTARSPPMATTGLARAWLEQHPRGEGIVLSQQSKDLIERCLPLEQSRRPLARMSVRPPSPQPPPPPQATIRGFPDRRRPALPRYRRRGSRGAQPCELHPAPRCGLARPG